VELIYFGVSKRASNSWGASNIAEGQRMAAGVAQVQPLLLVDEFGGQCTAPLTHPRPLGADA
jgi:hypothetical protein